MGTVITALVVVGIVGLIIKNMVEDRKAGKPHCGGSCKDCGGHCH